jgi:hypothetical protein
MSVVSRVVSGSAALTLTASVLSGCGGDGRSMKAFCSTIVSEQTRLSAKYEKQGADLKNQTDPLVGLLQALATVAEAQGDLVVYFDRLQKVAPKEIQPEAEAAYGAMKTQADAAKDALSNPVGSFAKGVLATFQSAGSFNRLDQYSKDNCGRGL